MNYLESARRQFDYYRILGEKAMAQLPDDALNWSPDAETNSIATIVRHLHGNMLSRWTDFLAEDGEKAWRNRDAEFEQPDWSHDELLQHWNAGWACLSAALDVVTDADLERIIYIRNEGHTILEAINRQLAHYPYHVGQIVFIAKLIVKGDWQSLSIPRNGSGAYNAGKFAQEKGVRHFTDGELGK